ncbi:MAG: YjfB family protein [Clostridia bacterium]|nr:YjfB family protein [Clostridia bacterium]
MDVNNILRSSIYSIRQAINLTALKKAMHQDSQTVTSLFEGMKLIQAKTMENAVNPHKGSNIDIHI